MKELLPYILNLFLLFFIICVIYVKKILKEKNLEILSLKKEIKDLTKYKEEKILNKPQNNDIVLTEEMKYARNCILESNYQIIWIYGGAGTGKTTFLNYIKKNLPFNFYCLSPTGMGALLIEGETIHKFFQLPILNNIFSSNFFNKQNITKNLSDKLESVDYIIIDEISMLRADVLDEIDRILKHCKKSIKSFGGVRFIFFGDPYQLPPVLNQDLQKSFYKEYKTKYFFSSNAYKTLLNEKKVKHIELTKVFRQQDDKFVNILRKIRRNNVSNENLELLNQRVGLGVDPYTLKVTTHKAEAKEINLNEYNKINNKEFIFTAIMTDSYLTPRNDYPAPKEIKIKIGTKIIILANKGNYTNGTIAIITDISTEVITARDNKKTYYIEKYLWEEKSYLKNGNSYELKTVGTYKQFPIDYGYAMTIHKAQGKTVDSIQIDLKRGTFETGQTYVALSRVKTLDGLFLTEPIKKSNFIKNNEVDSYFKYVRDIKSSSALKTKEMDLDKN